MARSITRIPPRQDSLANTALAQIQRKKVAAYCRVSTEQDQQLSSYEAQVSYYTNYINNNSFYECAGIFADEGISGTNTRKREQFNRMIEACKAGKIDIIITKSISRFARNTLDCLNYVRLLKELGIAVMFEKENINTLDAKGEVLLTILSSLAQDESRSISENTTWGIRRRFEQGKIQINTTRFLGYDKDEEGNLIINEKQAQTVRRIYQYYLDGRGFNYIARHLEADNVQTGDNGTKWYVSTVKKILTNEKYKGDVIVQKTYTVDFLNKVRVKNEGQITQYYIEENHPPIIEPEVWEAVQLEMIRRDEYAKENGLQRADYGFEDNPFAGKVICGKCGGAFGRKVWQVKNKPLRVWQCNNKHPRRGQTKCESEHFSDSKLSEVFVNTYNTLMDNKEQLLSKWEEESQSEDLLKRYRAKDFIKLIGAGEKLEDFDEGIMYRILEYIRVLDKKNVVVRLLDGTELECEMES